MSNILIIKHGSLGDIAQASGAIQDICENHSTDNIFLLTTSPYIDLFQKNKSLESIILKNPKSRRKVIFVIMLTQP